MRSELERIRSAHGRSRPGRLFALALASLSVAASVLVGSSVPARGAASACPSVNRPNMLKIVAGSPQTAQLGKPFHTNLQVTLANSNGCALTGPLGGYWVDFSAPASGPSGTFATSGTNEVTVGTDSSGTATAPEFTANDTPGGYTVHVTSDFGAVDLYLTNTASGVAASITASGQDEQAATVSTQYQQPLQARVLDLDGRPVQGASVTFSLGTGSSGASASFLGGGAQASETTNASGLASSPPFLANASPGRFTASASVSGVASLASYRLANHAAVTRIAGSPSAQTAVVKRQYAQPLRARVRDGAGHPIEGVTVTFTLPQAASGDAGATFLDGTSQATATTDARGRASSPRLLANATAGRFNATAAVASTRARYLLRNRPGKATTVTAGAASGQSAPLGSRFPIALAVTVGDAEENPVAGAVVLFVAPAQGPSGRFSTHGAGNRRLRVARVKTNADGIAVAPPLIANDKPGGYVVTATVLGTRAHAAFALVNTR
jgi:hypothetical protein